MSDKGFTQYDGYDIEYLKLTTNEGVEYDLKNFMIELNIYCEIFSPSMTGSILFADGVNMLSNLPIMGGEKVRVSWRTKGRSNWKRVDFRVERVSEREDGDKDSNYRIQLVSEDRFAEVATPTSRGYQGSYSDIIKSVMESLTQRPMELGQTSGIQTFASPMWTPFQIVEWCTRRSVGIDGSPLVFYEDLDGYKLRSVSDLVSSESKARLYKQPYGLENDPIKILRNIEQVEWRGNRNSMSLSATGCVGNLESVFDFNNKTVQNTHNTYRSHFESTPHLDKYPVSIDTRDHSYNIWNVSAPDGSHTGRFARDVLDNTLFYTSIAVILPGDDEFVLGGVYDFNLPSPEPSDNGDAPTEKYVSGRWLTTSIRHTLRTNGYTMAVDLAKDSYTSELKGKIDG
ncbi:tail protein [Vibrio phage K469]